MRLSHAKIAEQRGAVRSFHGIAVELLGCAFVRKYSRDVLQWVRVRRSRTVMVVPRAQLATVRRRVKQ